MSAASDLADQARDHFLGERYVEASRLYERALGLEPDRGDWREMHGLAEANAVARPDRPVPPFHLFDPDELLAPPTAPDGPDEGPLPAGPPGALTRIDRMLGRAVGLLCDGLCQPLIALHGFLFPYTTGLWTNWYRRGPVGGVLTLVSMRDRLNRENLRSTYPAGEPVGFVSMPLEPPNRTRSFRTAQGTWNDLENPKEGAAGTRFLRNVRNGAIRDEEAEGTLLSPNPRTVSRELLTRRGRMKEIPFLNLLSAVWIQFENHDWVSHGDNLRPDPEVDIRIELEADDPVFLRTGLKEMRVARTQPDPTRRPSDPTPRTFVNEVTHWWDASQIYGSDPDTQARLRSHSGGEMRLEAGLLPTGPEGVEDTGMVRNWWVGLSAMHLLFVKEHNAICHELRSAYPDLRSDDERLFQVARLINAAVIAKIHTVEWTPAILPNPTLDRALNANWFGLLTYLFRRPERRRTKAWLNVRQPELGGVVGNPVNKHGSPYGLTEEFVEVYRLHSLLPEALQVRRLGSGAKGGPAEEIPLAATRQSASPGLLRRIGLSDLLFSLGVQHPGELVLNNYPAFLQSLSVPGLPVVDLGAVDILRARERGVPRYNDFRHELGLRRITAFADLTSDPAVVAALERVYGCGPEGVARLDLLIGTLAEEPPSDGRPGHRPTGFGFGETLFQIFILNATRRLQADRFYTDDYDARTYTQAGLDWIDKATLKRVLLRHAPELGRTGLANVANAFEPWDTDDAKREDPRRHPRRSFPC